MPHILRSSMDLPLGIAEVFHFFSNASNLERITPSELGFQIITPPPIAIAEGVNIDYRLLLFGWPFIWQTKITHWDPPRQFVDEQIRGPYKLWIHTHRFSEKNGTSTIEDEVQYQLPLWPVGEVAYPLIGIQLQRIFRFRAHAIRSILLGTLPESAG